jgi:deoxyribonuclease V
MILATDVQYTQNSAKAAGIIFSDWDSEKPIQEIVTDINCIEPYEPGEFYKRELPCILALLPKVIHQLDMIIVDGYVNLGANAKPGLGMHLYNALNGTIPIIGVAKKSFIGTPDECKIFRGNSLNPLYITSAGITLNKAKSYILAMHGNYRNPSLLKKVDQLCRGIEN